MIVHIHLFWVVQVYNFPEYKFYLYLRSPPNSPWFSQKMNFVKKWFQQWELGLKQVRVVGEGVRVDEWCEGEGFRISLHLHLHPPSPSTSPLTTLTPSHTLTREWCVEDSLPWRFLSGQRFLTLKNIQVCSFWKASSNEWGEKNFSIRL